MVVESLGNAHPDVVPVLCNALSEQGAFQARGISRASSSMLYIMVLRVPPRVLALVRPPCCFRLACVCQSRAVHCLEKYQIFATR